MAAHSKIECATGAPAKPVRKVQRVKRLIPSNIEQVVDLPRLGSASCHRYHVPGRAERAQGTSLRIHRLRKLGGRNFNADRDIRRHGARQRNEIDAALPGKHPLVTGGVDHFLLRRRRFGRAVA